MSLTVPASGEFPVLEREGIAYLDSAATSQTPRSVIEAMDRYYLEARATVHRSTYPLAAEATELFEGARNRVAAFTGGSPASTIFTRNATEALNLVAWSWGRDEPRRRRPHRGDGDGAPLQHRPVADGGAGARGGARLDRHHRRRPARPRLARRGAGARAQDRRRRARLQRALHHQPAGGDRPPRARRRRDRRGRRLPGRPAHAGGRLGRRLLRLDRPQGLRPDRHRRAARPRASCSRRCRRGSAAGT